MNELSVGMLLPSLGTITAVRSLAPGVYWVTTVEHGGYALHREVIGQKLSPAARAQGSSDAEWICFEEDCAWALVAYEHPEWMVGPLDLFVVRGILQQEYPEYPL